MPGIPEDAEVGDAAELAAILRSVLSAEEYGEFHRLVKDIIRDGLETLSGRDVAVLAETAIFNVSGEGRRAWFHGKVFDE